MTDPIVLQSTGDVTGPASSTDNSMVLFDGTTGKKVKGNNAVVTAAGLAILDDNNNTEQRNTLGLGTIATQNSNNVTISGGNISGVNVSNSTATLTTLNVTTQATVPTVPQSDDSTKVVNTSWIRAFIASLVMPTPIGSVIDFAGAVAPDGYLPLPFQPTDISRTTYAKLFAAIGTQWGAGNGSTTFGMPWCPGWQPTLNGAGVYAGLTTTGEVKSHTHTFTAQQPIGGYTDDGGAPDQRSTSQSGTTGATGNTFNLPAGILMMKCVKYK